MLNWVSWKPPMGVSRMLLARMSLFVPVLLSLVARWLIDWLVIDCLISYLTWSHSRTSCIHLLVGTRVPSNHDILGVLWGLVDCIAVSDSHVHPVLRFLLWISCVVRTKACLGVSHLLFSVVVGFRLQRCPPFFLSTWVGYSLKLRPVMNCWNLYWRLNLRLLHTRFLRLHFNVLSIFGSCSIPWLWPFLFTFRGLWSLIGDDILLNLRVVLIFVP